MKGLGATEQRVDWNAVQAAVKNMDLVKVSLKGTIVFYDRPSVQTTGNGYYQQK